MSVRVVQVDESQKDEPGVEKAVTTIAGRSIETYARLERVDDIDGKTTENVVEIQILVPVEDEDSDDPDNLYVYNRAVIDMGEASLTKYLKAISTYADKARLLPAQVQSTSAPVKGNHPELTKWNRRAKDWLRQAGHDVKERGRIPSHLEEIYSKNHPNDPKPE
ncbi:histone-like nucleoid-structuring protein Lsr2 [Streptomyces sp. NPDC058471]|uniref:Lsr2 dimerization domain-containing protein n=1 Tax=Streptomyces sp. NPDC058471 TaxID=3346516 RepID=UPI00365454C5